MDSLDTQTLKYLESKDLDENRIKEVLDFSIHTYTTFNKSKQDYYRSWNDLNLPLRKSWIDFSIEILSFF
jgi:hypothetical protein